LIGFDDIPEAAYLDPGLTTVAQDFDQVGTRSLELLVKLINREKLPGRRLAIEPGLIVRQSTCNAPK
jgi:LacI family transcriptional regulator